MDLAQWSDQLLPAQGVTPWWPAVEPTPRWIRVRVGADLAFDSRRALLLLQYGGHRQLPTYDVPRDDVRPGVLVDERHDIWRRAPRAVPYPVVVTAPADDVGSHPDDR